MSMDTRERIAKVLREHGAPLGMGDEMPGDEYDCCVDLLLPFLAEAWERGHFYCAAEEGTDKRCTNPYGSRP